jgi:hypothetical protein
VIQALVINVPAHYLPDPTWRLLWASMTYRITSSAITEYKMIALSRSRGALIDGPTILTHQSAFTDIYKLELLSSQWARSQQLTFISSLVSDCSLIILKDVWDGADFASFEVDSIQITSSKILGGS